MRFYKRDPDRALSGMTELSLQQRGAYNTILDTLYARDGILRNDDEMLRRIMGCHGNEWRAVKVALIEAGKIWIEGDYIKARGVDAVLEEAEKVSETQRKNATKRRENAGKSQLKDGENPVKSRLKDGENADKSDLNSEKDERNQRSDEAIQRERERERENNIVVSDIDIHSEAAREITGFFRQLEGNVFAHPPRNPHHTDFQTARLWSMAGIRLADVEPIIRESLEHRAAMNQSAPRTLSYFDAQVRESVAKAGSNVRRFVSSEPFWQTIAREIRENTREKDNHPAHIGIVEAIRDHDHDRANNIAHDWAMENAKELVKNG